MQIFLSLSCVVLEGARVVVMTAISCLLRLHGRGPGSWQTISFASLWRWHGLQGHTGYIEYIQDGS